MRIKRYVSMTLCLLLIFSSVAIPSAAKKAQFNKKTAKKNIKATYQVKSEGILATYKNKNKYAVKIKMNIKYYDAAGQTVAKEPVVCECLGSKKTMVYFFKAPDDGKGGYINYNTYKASFSVAKPTYKDSTKSVNVITDVQPTNCKILVQNLGKKKLSTINLTLCFYDANGKFIVARNQYIKGMDANTTIEQEVNYSGYTPPKSVKVYKNWAY